MSVNALQTLSQSQMTQQMGRAGRTDEGDHITMMSFRQYEDQLRSQDLAQLVKCDLTPMILRSLASGRSIARVPFLCPPDPLVHLRAKERTFFRGMLDSRRVTQMTDADVAMDSPCDWAAAQFLHTRAERGMEDSALVIITTWYREGPRMTQQF